MDSPPGQELLGVITSHGPSRESYRPSRKSRGWPAEAIGPPAADAALSAERVRAALSSPAGAPALLQRECREAARKWSRWKAQQRYRETAAGQQKRNGQSRRYRERVKSRKPPEPEAVNEPARVITTEHFFRAFAATGQAATRDSCAQRRSPLQRFCSHACRRALERVRRTGAALETGARFNPEILIRRRHSPYIQPV